MQFIEVQENELKIPDSEFHFFRSSKEFQNELSDSYLIGVRFQNKIYAWNKIGSKPIIQNNNLKTRVLLYPDTQSLFQVYLTWVKTTFESQSATEAEWVNCLKTIEEYFKFDLSVEKIPKYLSDAMTSCGFESHLGVLAQRKKYSFLNYDELQFLHDKKWDPSTFELFDALDKNLRLTFLKLLSRIQLSQQQVKECIGFTLTIEKKLGLNAALSILESSTKTAEEMRVLLFRTAQPELFRMNEERVRKLRSLKTPPRTAIHADPSFENDAIKIAHTPRNMTDLELFKNWLENEETTENFHDLLNIRHQ